MCLVGEELKVFMNLVVRLLGEAKGVCESRVLIFNFFFFFELEFHMFPHVLFLHVKLPPLGTQVLETRVSYFELKSLRLKMLV